MSGQLPTDNNYNTNLASILRTLSTYTDADPPTQAAAVTEDLHSKFKAAEHVSAGGHDQTLPVSEMGGHSSLGVSAQPYPMLGKDVQPGNRSRHESGSRFQVQELNPRYPDRQKRPCSFENPKNIRTWPTALRFTTKLLYDYPAVVERIRALIKTQRLNEHQWWVGREDFIRIQTSRKDGEAQIQKFLNSIGANMPGVNESADEAAISESDMNDLKGYDLKVHRLMNRIINEQEEELAKLGIPFFGLSKEAKEEFAVGILKDLKEKMLQFLQEFVADDLSENTPDHATRS